MVAVLWLSVTKIIYHLRLNNKGSFFQLTKILKILNIVPMCSNEITDSSSHWSFLWALPCYWSVIQSTQYSLSPSNIKDIQISRQTDYVMLKTQTSNWNIESCIEIVVSRFRFKTNMCNVLYIGIDNQLDDSLECWVVGLHPSEELYTCVDRVVEICFSDNINSREIIKKFNTI